MRLPLVDWTPDVDPVWPKEERIGGWGRLVMTWVEVPCAVEGAVVEPA